MPDPLPAIIQEVTQVVLDINVLAPDGVASIWQTGTSYTSYKDLVRGVDGSYACITTHVSGSPTQPGVGANWEDYWFALALDGSSGVVEDVPANATNRGYRPTNAQTGTSYTLVLSDAGKLVTLSNAAAIALTIPSNSSVAFGVGTEIDLAQLGAGQVTLSGSTIRSHGSKLKLAGQYAGATLKKIGTDEWLLAGNLSA